MPSLIIFCYKRHLFIWDVVLSCLLLLRLLLLLLTSLSSFKLVILVAAVGGWWQGRVVVLGGNPLVFVWREFEIFNRRKLLIDSENLECILGCFCWKFEYTW